MGTRQGFRALGAFVSELWTKTCRTDTAEGQKFKIFNVFEFHHAGCLHRGFQTRWIDSWCLFTLRWLVFGITGQNLLFWTHGGSKIPCVFKARNYVILGFYDRIFRSTDSIPGVHFILGWLVFGIMAKILIFGNHAMEAGSEVADLWSLKMQQIFDFSGFKTLVR